MLHDVDRSDFEHICSDHIWSQEWSRIRFDVSSCDITEDTYRVDLDRIVRTQS